MDIELKSCLFCGEPYAITLRARYGRGRWIVFARCDMCGAQSRCFSCEEDPEIGEWSNDACYKAGAAWNKRPVGGA